MKRSAGAADLDGNSRESRGLDGLWGLAGSPEREQTGLPYAEHRFSCCRAEGRLALCR